MLVWEGAGCVFRVVVWGYRVLRDFIGRIYIYVCIIRERERERERETERDREGLGRLVGYMIYGLGVQGARPKKMGLFRIQDLR